MAPKSPAGFLYNFIGRGAAQAADPRNYQFLQRAAGDVLSRAIPQNVNWGGLTTGFLDRLSGISQMAPGAAKEAARSQAKTTLVRAAAQPPARPAGAVNAGGVVRAPGLPGQRPQAPVLTAPTSTPLPGNNPYNIDYALRRASGLTGSAEQLAKKLGIPVEQLKKVQLPLPFQMPSEGMLGPSSPLGQITAKTSMFAREPQNMLQGGVDTAKGIFRNLQGRIPTAINPLATRTPTTLLGKVGQVFNPLNPANLLDAANPMPGISAGARLAQSLGIAGTTPGLLTTVGGGLAAYGAFDALFPAAAGVEDEKEAAYLRQSLAQNTRPVGGDASIRDAQGRVWAGRNYGFQSPESFRKLYGANVGIAPGSLQPPEAPAPPALLDPGLQAGQLTPPPLAPRVPPGVVSNGAGAPAQRQNVQERALSQEVLNAAQQYAAPAGVSLPSFYASQQQLGRSMEQGGELQRRLKDLGAFAGMSDQALMDWTRQNPGLAYRELMKLQARNPQM
jgi:hypothetical protein